MSGARRAIERQEGLRIAAAFIAHFEGGMSRDGKFHAYWDPNGRVWTQGFGHTKGVGPRSSPWSRGKALRVLRGDLANEYGAALDKLRLPLNRNQYAAILSAIYNLGVGLLDPSHDLGRELRAHHWHKAADSLREYVMSGGKKLPGLVTRREAERHLFLRPV